MIRRPVDPRFTDAILEGRKITTIREKPWPVGVPIMLYNWSGKPYRSPQKDVAEIVVTAFWRIHIAHADTGRMVYSMGPLWREEGFNGPDELNAWFRPLVKRGTVATKHLMRFRLHGKGGPK